MIRIFLLALVACFSCFSSFAEGPLFRVGSGRSCAYADKEGRVLIPEGKYLSSYAKIKKPVLLQSATSDSCFWVDANGVELFAVYKFDDRMVKLTAGRMRVVKDGRTGFVDKKGRVVVPLVYAAADLFWGKYAAVAKANAQYSATDLASSPITDLSWGLIDKKGREVKPMRYQRVWSPELSTLIYLSENDSFYLNEKGKIVTLPPQK